MTGIQSSGLRGWVVTKNTVVKKKKKKEEEDYARVQISRAVPA